ncbi:sigma-70 family RNA polymerase sigma factor [Streptomyces chromofuscus]|uniref:Sigma-70 family RNA polymerase sigma factor n=1 Tax=Streptomyces chromofuscus TaxID=42881 RepID=A0A7M2T345_STRCW|nr:sigma-70 family RNA polymerase sigma factor [Streptomyces chromofuscus]QOV42305.1 sigma-70 family RNA polymerase sigma factor [Streptomyces chromofuscus]GGT34436.1 DNA-directed RNA polymerase sigma-70 factor [Streptomyces chromofuscus]
MGDVQTLSAARFETDRPHLRAVAYRMLGSLSDAEDAVQETWLRAERADIAGVQNLTGWLTTVTGRVCLNMLRSRRARPEQPYDDHTPTPEDGVDPEQEALLADSVGVAMLVVLNRLAPAERLAFVLHDLFAVPFDDIAPLVERTPAATRQPASRARRRVRGGAPATADLVRQREAVDAFLAAARGGDFEGLLALLDPDVVLTADKWVVPTPEAITLTGARPVAESALAATARARFTGPALLDGRVGLAMAPLGRLTLVLTFTVTATGITRIEVVADRDRLEGTEVAVLDA